MKNCPNDASFEKLKLCAERLGGKSKLTQIFFNQKNLPKLHQIYRQRKDTIGDKTIDQFCEESIESIDHRMRRLQNLNPSIISREDAMISKILKSFEKDNFKSIDSYISHLVLKKTLDLFVETLPKDSEELSKRMREGMENIVADESKLKIIIGLVKSIEYGKHDPSDFLSFDDIEGGEGLITSTDNGEYSQMKRVKLFSTDHDDFREFLQAELKAITIKNEVSHDFFDNFCIVNIKNLADGRQIKLVVDFLKVKIFLESEDPETKERLVEMLLPNHNLKENMANILHAWRVLPAS